MSKCQCSFRVSMVGDGCRYCQPQEYIDRLHEQTEDDSKEIELLRGQRDQLLEALNEAKYLVADWGAYASPYFQEKHDLSGDIAKIEAVIAAVEANRRN